MTATGIDREAMHGRTAAISVRRLANESVLEVATRFDADEGGLFDFLCECGDLGCTDVVKLTISDYRSSEPGSIVRH